MNESLLHAFLVGERDGATLADALEDVIGIPELTPGVNLVMDLHEEVPVEAKHLVTLCDAVLSGELDGDDLKATALFLMASEHFTWDSSTGEGALVAAVLHEWAAPEINYPLTRHTILRYREALAIGAHPFAR